MRDLLVRLTTSDGGAADALRVIAHFDTLVDQRASAFAMLRAASALAECPVGFADRERGVRAAADGSGRIDGDAPAPPAAARHAQFDGITVWLCREGPAWPLDDLILERLARSLQAIKRLKDVSSAAAGIRILCDAESSPAERADAARRLGLGASVTVVVTRVADGDALPPGCAVGEAEQVHLLDPVAVRRALPATVAAGLRTCEPAAVHREWRNATIALHLAADPDTGGPMHVRFEDLGGLAVVAAHLPAEVAAADADVLRLMELQAERGWVVSTVHSMVRGMSVREAARSQHLHHSTLRQRLDWLAERLGYDPAGDGRERATTALILWRIASAAASAAGAAVAGAVPTVDRRTAASAHVIAV